MSHIIPVNVNFGGDSFKWGKKRRASSSSSTVVTEEEILGEADNDLIEKGLEFISEMETPPQYSEFEPLVRPIVIPQMASKFGVPFTRAYAPILESRGIKEHDFLEFIDGLNIVSTPHFMFLIMLIVAEVLDATNVDVLEIAAAALMITAVMGTVIMCKRRAKLFLKKTNKRLFHHRGLHVRIVSSKDLVEILNLPSRDDLIRPFSSEQLSMSVHERRMHGLNEKVHPITFEVQEPSRKTNILAKIAAFQVSRTYKGEQKVLMKAREKNTKRLQKQNTLSSLQKPAGIEKHSTKLDLKKESLDTRCEQINAKYDELLAKDPSSSGKLESQRKTDLDKLSSKYDRLYEKYNQACQKSQEKHERSLKKCERKLLSGDHERKAMKRLNWILIEDVSISSS
ncbi:hypothetical protein TRICI_002694 [Trichomonascus ciferrii]|uniref:Uncharacterized protein n=1 Tax=Trichomonascus ciferrii TaxID=44093 RepID=A0A642V606_9ASCO|nr:hypothetical protein TRICI_002694 [Trichomonascus ciferrii]